MTKAQKRTVRDPTLRGRQEHKEIAKLTHKSIRDISDVIKRHQENIERENGQLEDRSDDYNIKSKSKTTQAIKMFSEGQSPTDVVIELDLSPVCSGRRKDSLSPIFRNQK
jgi:hypothetical protein